MPRKITPEGIVKKQVKDYLRFMGWFVFHIQQNMGSYPGIADLIACKGGEVLFVELKAPRGRQSENQVKFEKNLKDHGCHYVLAYSWDDVSQYIREMSNEDSNSDDSSDSRSA